MWVNVSGILIVMNTRIVRHLRLWYWLKPGYHWRIWSVFHLLVNGSLQKQRGLQKAHKLERIILYHLSTTSTCHHDVGNVCGWMTLKLPLWMSLLDNVDPFRSPPVLVKPSRVSFWENSHQICSAPTWQLAAPGAHLYSWKINHASREHKFKLCSYMTF